MLLHLLASLVALAADASAGRALDVLNTASRNLLQTEAEPLAPYGWWSALTTANSNCSLRHYPPTGDAGTCYLICPPAGVYNNEFLFRLQKANTSLIAASSYNISTALTYQLRNWNLENSYVMVDVSTAGKAALLAGNQQQVASSFQVVRGGSASGSLNLTTDSFFLKANGLFCNAKGNGQSAYVKCASPSQSSATAFKMPYNSYYGVTLTNLAANVPCGAMEIQLSPGAVSYVNCTKPTLAPSNYKSVLSMGLMMPGKAAFYSGMNVGFKVYDDLYRYQIFDWLVGGSSPYNVTLVAQGSSSSRQWFTLSAAQGFPGQTLTNGTIVTLKSLSSNAFCGVGPAPAYQLRCDKVTTASSDTAYQFKFGMV